MGVLANIFACSRLNHSICVGVGYQLLCEASPLAFGWGPQQSAVEIRLLLGYPMQITQADTIIAQDLP